MKSSFHRFIIPATLRECFPTRVLLGSISDPLVPLPDCSQKDITDDRSGSIFACLCDTDFCNDGQNVLDNQIRAVQSQPARLPTSRQELPRSSQGKQEGGLSCPAGFEVVEGEEGEEQCYFLSTERVGWIEARKKCESKAAQLVSLDSRKKIKSLSEHITRSTR